MTKKPLTKEFLINRGFCCGNKCQNCPYVPKYIKGTTKIEELKKENNGKTI
jgi:hypothetical protein